MKARLFRISYSARCGLLGSLLAGLLWPCGLPPKASAQDETAQEESSDAWLTNEVQYARFTPTNRRDAVDFNTLKAEAIARKIKLSWRPEIMDTNLMVQAWVSFDAPGHWPARDWRSHSMIPRPASWDISIPVMDVDLPLMYYLVTANSRRETNVSRMRLCHPRLLGIEEPSKVFWPFLEGFEENLEGWQLINAPKDTPPLTTNRLAVNGYASLQVSLPADRRNATVATTVLRGWHVTHFSAKGLRLWGRTSEGNGQATFAFVAHAGTTNQVIGAAPVQAALKPEWQRFEIPLPEAADFPVAALDLVTIELSAASPTDFLLDEISLLGHWRLELEK